MLLTYGFYACRHSEVSQEVSHYCLAGWTQHGSKVNEIIIWTIQKHCLLKLVSSFLCFKAYFSFLSFLLIKKE